MGWIRCLCSLASLCPLLALASLSQAQHTQALAHSALWGLISVYGRGSWPSSLTVSRCVCRQNVTAQLTFLCCHQSLTSIWILPTGQVRSAFWGNLVMVQVGSLLGLWVGTVFLRSAWTQRAMMNIPGPSAKPLSPAQDPPCGGGDTWAAPQAGLAGQSGLKGRQPSAAWGLLFTLLCSPVRS